MLNNLKSALLIASMLAVGGIVGGAGTALAQAKQTGAIKGPPGCEFQERGCREDLGVNPFGEPTHQAAPTTQGQAQAKTTKATKTTARHHKTTRTQNH
jgi:hypothetical protein